MKYKAGDKFVVEIEKVEEEVANPYTLKLEGGECGNWICSEGFLNQLQKTACSGEEAWETAKQIMFAEEFTHDVLNEIFGTMNHYAIMRDYKPNEVKAKIDEWKKQKEEVKVGDVLRCGNNKCIVTRVSRFGVYVVWDDGSAGEHDIDKMYDYKKTGERIELDAIFEQLGGKKND